ncbi:hypothetical protein D3C81_2317480 [compost metagenome]
MSPVTCNDPSICTAPCRVIKVALAVMLSASALIAVDLAVIASSVTTALLLPTSMLTVPVGSLMV